MYSAIKSSCHPVTGLAAGEYRIQIVQGPETHGISGLTGGATDVGQQEGIVESGVAGVDIRFVVEDV